MSTIAKVARVDRARFSCPIFFARISGLYYINP